MKHLYTMAHDHARDAAIRRSDLDQPHWPTSVFSNRARMRNPHRKTPSRWLPSLALFLVCLASPSRSSAQNVGVNATGSAPNVSAGLDVDFTNKGLLIPRVALTSLTDAVTILTPATSLLVYNTNGAVPGGTGHYFNSGTPASPVWARFLTTSSAANAWLTTGNAGTVDGTHFIGTTDNIPFNIRVNNQKAGRVDHLQYNTFLGYQAGNALTTGTSNSALGYTALQALTTG